MMTMRGERGWWPWVLVAAAVALLMFGMVITLLPLGGEDGLQKAANTAQLTAFTLAAGCALVTAVTWALRKTRRAAVATMPGVLEQAKAVLAGDVAEQWKREERVRLLADPDPIPVLWRSPADNALMDHDSNIDGTTLSLPWTARSDNVGALADRFRRTRRRRLVLLGGPGTGKTTLAVQLVLHLLDLRREHPDDPVPVLLPVADWDVTKFPHLHDWLATRLSEDYPALRSPELGASATSSLASRGCILPVLDGLDELPQGTRAEVIRALNRSLGSGDQLILTSRTAEFTDAVGEAGEVVNSAAVLQPLQLAPAVAADYLARTQPPVPGPGWDEVLAALRAAPCGAATGTLGAALSHLTSTPLGLWLVRTVYTAPGADPAELIDSTRFPTPAALRDHLYEQLVTAVIASRPPGTNSADPFRPRKHHDPDDTRRWLGFLAQPLTSPECSCGRPCTRGIRWWCLTQDYLAKPPSIKLLSGLISGCVGALAGGLIGGPTALVVGLMMGINSVAMGGYAVNAWSRGMPGSVNLRLRGRTRELIGELAFGLGVVFPLLLGFGLLMGHATFGLTFGLTLGIAFGLARGGTIGLSRWMEVPALTAGASTPVSSWRADRLLNLVRLLMLGIAYGIAFGVVAGVRYGVVEGIVFGLAAIGPLGFVTAAGLGMGTHRTWLGYLFARHHLARRRLLPRDLMGFLDDAHRLGLLRTVGPIYQFRHTELQDHLAAAYRQSGGRS